MSDSRNQLTVLPVFETPVDKISSFFRNLLNLNKEGVFFELSDDFLYQVLKLLTLQDILNFLLVSKHCKQRIDAFDAPLFAFRLKSCVLKKASLSVSSLRHLYLFRDVENFPNGIRRDEFYAIAVSDYKVCELSRFQGALELTQKPFNKETIKRSLEKTKKIYLFRTKEKALAKLKAYKLEEDNTDFDFAYAYPLLLVCLSNSSILDFVHHEFRKRGTRKVVLPPNKLSEMELISGELYFGDKKMASSERVILRDFNKKTESCNVM